MESVSTSLGVIRVHDFPPRNLRYEATGEYRRPLVGEFFIEKYTGQKWGAKGVDRSGKKWIAKPVK